MAEARRDYEILVLGGGPAGMAAACVAAESGARVALLDSAPQLGGQIGRGATPGTLPRPLRHWMRGLHAGSTDVLTQTTALAAPKTKTLYAEQAGRPLEIGFEQLVLAVGARERFLPFPGWTLPNVLGPGALQVLGKEGWPVEGKRIVVAGSGPLLIAVAAYLRQKGADVRLIAEQSTMAKLVKFTLALPYLSPGKLVQACGLQWRLGITRYRTGCWPAEAGGDTHVEEVTLTNGRRTWTEPCDYLACAFGLLPNLEWPRLLGCKIDGDRVVCDDGQETSIPGVYCAGEASGIAGIEAALIEGQIAGYSAAGQHDDAKRLASARERAGRFSRALEDAFALREELRSLPTEETIVCRCEDVTHSQIDQHDNLRSARIHTRCGMGACQGRTCHGAIEFLYGWDRGSARPPVLPTRVDTLAGIGND